MELGREHLPGVFENLFGLRAVVRGGVAVRGEHAQRETDFQGDRVDRELVEAHLLQFLFALLLRFPVIQRVVLAGLVEELVDVDAVDVLPGETGAVVFIAPDEEGDFPLVLRLFRLDDGVADPLGEVSAGGELLSVHADDHIAPEEPALGRRALDRALHLKLVPGDVARKEAGDARRAEIPELRRKFSNGQVLPFGQVGQFGGSFGLRHLAPVLDGLELFGRDFAFIRGDDGREPGQQCEEKKRGCVFHGRCLVSRVGFRRPTAPSYAVETIGECVAVKIPGSSGP
jgi:hypothetical protein